MLFRSAITHLRFHLPLTIIYLIFLFLLLVFFLFLEVHNILNFKRNNSRIALYFRPIHQSTIYYLPAFLVISFIVLVTQTDNTSRPQGFFTMIGSLHTGKFAFVADLIRGCGYVPNIQTNFGQSILTSFLGYRNQVSSPSLLYTILSLSLFSLSIFCFG